MHVHSKSLTSTTARYLWQELRGLQRALSPLSPSADLVQVAQYKWLISGLS